MTSLNGPVSVSSPGAPPVDVSSPSGGSVVVAPGQRGPVGPGLELTGTVEAYEDLPSGLGLGDVAHYLVNGDGRLYSWSGVSWPPKGGGAPFKGDQGDRGNGVASIAVAVDDLRFSMTDGHVESVSVPALTDARTFAGEAAGSAAAAAGSRSQAGAFADIAEGFKDDAAVAAAGAAAARDTAVAARDGAAGSAAVAEARAGEAAGSAAAARQSEINAEQSEVNADASETVSVDRAGVASSAATVATDKAGEAAGHASTAGTYEQEARTAAQAARAAADEALTAVEAGMKPAGPDQLGGVFLPGDSPGGLGGSADSPVVVGWDDKADLVGGKIPTSQIPSVALTETRVVNTSAERLALTDVQTGDVCVQVQNPGRGTYILRGVDPAVEGDWQMFSVPTESVTSVNGYNGAVTLSKNDLGLSNVENTTDAAKPVSTATQTALNAKAAAARRVSAGTGLSGGGDLTADRTLAVNYGTAAGTACQGNDARLSNARTPVAHSHSQSEVNGLVDALAGKANGAVSLVVSTSAPAAGTPNTTITFRTA